MHAELHPNWNISYYLVYCVHVNVVIGSLPLGGDLYEKDKHFPASTSQGMCALEVNEV